MLLVTGARGFIGSHLVTTLQSRGIPVRRVTRTPDGIPGSVAIGEFGPQTDWTAAVQGVDCVVHLAALAHVDVRTVPDALATYRRVNAAGTIGLAHAALRAGVRRFVFVSTAKVNGETSGTRPFETSDLPAPTDPYGISKFEAEEGIRALADGMQVVIVRPPLVYGPGVKANFLRLMEIVDRGIPLPLASIRNARSLVGVGNLCDLLIHAGTAAGKVDGTFFVSDGEDLSTPELIRRIARAAGRPARLLPFPPALLTAAGRLLGKSGAVERLCGSLQVDLAETRRVLGWQPVHTVDACLAATVRWWHENRRAAG